MTAPSSIDPARFLHDQRAARAAEFRSELAVSDHRAHPYHSASGANATRVVLPVVLTCSRGPASVTYRLPASVPRQEPSTRHYHRLPRLCAQSGRGLLEAEGGTGVRAYGQRQAGFGQQQHARGVTHRGGEFGARLRG
jgi:hypothetical protein